MIIPSDTFANSDTTAVIEDGKIKFKTKITVVNETKTFIFNEKISSPSASKTEEEPAAAPVEVSEKVDSDELPPTESPIETSSPVSSPTEAPEVEDEEILESDLDIDEKSPTSTPEEEPNDTMSPTISPTEELVITSSPISSPTEEPVETSSPISSPTEEPVETLSPTSIPVASPTVASIEVSEPVDPTTVDLIPVEEVLSPTSVPELADVTSAPTFVPPNLPETDTSDINIQLNDADVVDIEIQGSATALPSEGGSAFATSTGSADEFVSQTVSRPPYFKQDALKLQVLAQGEDDLIQYLKQIAKDFERETDGNIRVKVTESIDISAVIRGDVREDVSFYDGYIINPTTAGLTDVVYDFANLDDYIESDDLNWKDVFPTYRDINRYNGTIKLIPLEGDVLSLYYRKDIIEHFNLTVPRTWVEYNNVAGQLHGEEFNNQTLIGSCIPRRKGCASYFWSNLVLSSLTQYQGSHSGFMFDPLTMEPLTGEALERALQYLEGQVAYGAEDEFDKCDTYETLNVINWMNDGCVLTYNWGSVFKSQIDPDSDVNGLIGAAPTPGSLYVYDREARQLQRCSEELCSTYGNYDPDYGWINRAPYAAFGGFSGGVPKNVEPGNLGGIMKFLAYASSYPNKTSDPLSIPHDPYRESQLSESAFIESGFTEDGAEEYLSTVASSLSSGNSVIDLRFPEASKVNQAFETQVTTYLEQLKTSGEPTSSEARLALIASIDEEFQNIIEFHDANNEVPLVTQYQMSMNFDETEVSSFAPSGAFSAQSNMNIVGSILPFFITILFLLR